LGALATHAATSIITAVLAFARGDAGTETNIVQQHQGIIFGVAAVRHGYDELEGFPRQDETEDVRLHVNPVGHVCVALVQFNVRGFQRGIEGAALIAVWCIRGTEIPDVGREDAMGGPVFFEVYHNGVLEYAAAVLLELFGIELEFQERLLNNHIGPDAALEAHQPCLAHARTHDPHEEAMRRGRGPELVDDTAITFHVPSHQVACLKIQVCTILIQEAVRAVVRALEVDGAAVPVSALPAKTATAVLAALFAQAVGHALRVG